MSGLDTAAVYERFRELAGLGEEETRFVSLANDACRYIESIKSKRELSKSDEKRLELLAAAYTFRLFSMCGSEELRSFVAGDVRITSSAGVREKAESLWNALSAENSDLVGGSGFLFGRVM